MRKSYLLLWILPLALIILFAPFSAWLDLRTSAFFYSGEGSFCSTSLLDFYFTYGEVFGFLIGVPSLVFLLVSRFYNRWAPLRLPAFFLVMSLIIGPGVIVNLTMKQFWGRPRPLQIHEFGGKHDFRPFWSPKISIYSEHALRSFPSGHSSMGFYNLAFIFLGRRYKIRTLTSVGAGLTAFWGIGLMFTRIAQGGHFLSDVLISPIIMLWVMILLDRFLYGNHKWSIQVRKHILALPDDLVYMQTPLRLKEQTA